jgi:hypothetical protein
MQTIMTLRGWVPCCMVIEAEDGLTLCITKGPIALWVGTISGLNDRPCVYPHHIQGIQTAIADDWDSFSLPHIIALYHDTEIRHERGT